MDERSFVEQKRESWQILSDALEEIRKHGPRRLSRYQLSALGAQYRALVSDLAYARSQSASDDLLIYLNELAARSHGVLYSAPPARAQGLVSLFVREFPALFRSTIAYTLCAAFIFFGAWMIPATNPRIRDALIPQKITVPKNGEETSNVIEDIDPAMLSSFIMTNNIQVGILAFAGGMTAGVVTVYQLAQNGMVIGAVASKAAPVMGSKRFWSLILPHGIIELTAIFICGAAGLLIGSSMIAPGNLRRRDAVRLAGGKAIRLFAGAVFMFVIAGVIEGFVTPSPLPAMFKLTFAGVTALVLAWYFCFAGTREGEAPAEP